MDFDVKGAIDGLVWRETAPRNTTGVPGLAGDIVRTWGAAMLRPYTIELRT